MSDIRQRIIADLHGRLDKPVQGDRISAIPLEGPLSDEDKQEIDAYTKGRGWDTLFLREFAEPESPAKADVQRPVIAEILRFFVRRWIINLPNLGKNASLLYTDFISVFPSHAVRSQEHHGERQLR